MKTYVLIGVKLNAARFAFARSLHEIGMARACQPSWRNPHYEGRFGGLTQLGTGRRVPLLGEGIAGRGDRPQPTLVEPPDRPWRHRPRLLAFCVACHYAIFASRFVSDDRRMFTTLAGPLRCRAPFVACATPSPTRSRRRNRNGCHET